MSEPIILRGKEETRVATLLSLASALAIEIRTGMTISSRGSALKAARIQRVIPQTGRYTRKQALDATVGQIKAMWPAYEPNSFVAEALKK